MIGNNINILKGRYSSSVAAVNTPVLLSVSTNDFQLTVEWSDFNTKPVTLDSVSVSDFEITVEYTR